MDARYPEIVVSIGETRDLNTLIAMISTKLFTSGVSKKEIQNFIETAQTKSTYRELVNLIMEYVYIK